MTAKEMFEKLGMRRCKNTIFKEWLRYETKAGLLGREVTFDLKLRDITTNGNITIELHQAITQQMKELGWLE